MREQLPLSGADALLKGERQVEAQDEGVAEAEDGLDRVGEEANGRPGRVHPENGKKAKRRSAKV